jgi:hypothetical protein
MLKSSPLCLYSSNLGTFWLQIEQFWPFEEISNLSHGGHLGYIIVKKIIISTLLTAKIFTHYYGNVMYGNCQNIDIIISKCNMEWN